MYYIQSQESKIIFFRHLIVICFLALCLPLAGMQSGHEITHDEAAAIQIRIRQCKRNIKENKRIIRRNKEKASYHNAARVGFLSGLSLIGASVLLINKCQKMTLEKLDLTFNLAKLGTLLAIASYVIKKETREDTEDHLPLLREKEELESYYATSHIVH